MLWWSIFYFIRLFLRVDDGVVGAVELENGAERLVGVGWEVEPVHPVHIG